MNISSVIIKINPKYLEQITQNIHLINGVEMAMSEGEIIIATIEAKDFSEEMNAFRELEKINGVLCVSMHYCYYEDENQKVLSDKEILEQIEGLNDSENISYKGDVNTWIGK